MYKLNIYCQFKKRQITKQTLMNQWRLTSFHTELIALKDAVSVELCIMLSI